MYEHDQQKNIFFIGHTPVLCCGAVYMYDCDEHVKNEFISKKKFSPFDTYVFKMNSRKKEQQSNRSDDKVSNRPKYSENAERKMYVFD